MDLQALMLVTTLSVNVINVLAKEWVNLTAIFYPIKLPSKDDYEKDIETNYNEGSGTFDDMTKIFGHDTQEPYNNDKYSSMIEFEQGDITEKVKITTDFYHTMTRYYDIPVPISVEDFHQNKETTNKETHRVAIVAVTEEIDHAEAQFNKDFHRNNMNSHIRKTNTWEHDFHTFSTEYDPKIKLARYGSEAFHISDMHTHLDHGTEQTLQITSITEFDTDTNIDDILYTITQYADDEHQLGNRDISESDDEISELVNAITPEDERNVQYDRKNNMIKNNRVVQILGIDTSPSFNYETLKYPYRSFPERKYDQDAYIDYNKHLPKYQNELQNVIVPLDEFVQDEMINSNDYGLKTDHNDYSPFVDYHQKANDHNLPAHDDTPVTNTNKNVKKKAEKLKQININVNNKLRFHYIRGPYSRPVIDVDEVTTRSGIKLDDAQARHNKHNMDLWTTTATNNVISNHHADNTTVADALKKRIKLLCWIMTCPKFHKERAIHIKKTWGKRCDVLLFMSTEYDPVLQTIPLSVKEGRQYLWAKTQAAFKYIYDNYIYDAEWFLKADDDTYVIVENVRHLLNEYNTNDPIYFGCRFKYPKLVKQGYMSGGAGYVLSRQAVIRLVNKGLNTNLCDGKLIEEDLSLGICLEKLEVKAMDSRDSKKRGRFFPFVPHHHLQFKVDTKYWYWNTIFYPIETGRNCCSEYAISFHYMTPALMYTMEFFVYHLKVYGISYNFYDIMYNDNSLDLV